LISTHRKNEKTLPRHANQSPVEDELMYLQSLKIQAGWIMMEQLLSFDIHWVGSKLKALFGLWQQEFSYEANDLSNLDEQLNYLKVSVPCLKTLRTFLRKCKTLHTDHVLKLVGTYLMNFFNAFLTDTEKDKWKAGNERQVTEYSLAKIVRLYEFFFLILLNEYFLKEFFRCICSISPRFYQQKLNLLVQNVMEDIFVSNFCNMIGVIKKFFDPEDLFIGSLLKKIIFLIDYFILQQKIWKTK